MQISQLPSLISTNPHYALYKQFILETTFKGLPILLTDLSVDGSVDTYIRFSNFNSSLSYQAKETGLYLVTIGLPLVNSGYDVWIFEAHLQLDLPDDYTINHDPIIEDYFGFSFFVEKTVY